MIETRAQQTTRRVVYWTCDEEAERLTATTVEQAVRKWAVDHVGPLPETVTVYGHAPVVPNPLRYEGTLLDALIEWLDDEYGDPDGSPTQPTDDMHAAERAFIEAVLAEYQPCTCEVVEERTVRVRDYVDWED